MFSKLEVLGALTVSLVGGLVCGYCGARAFCLLAIVFFGRCAEGTRSN